MTGTDKTNTDLLTRRLRFMFHQAAIEQPGRTVRHTLKGGLRLAMKAQREGDSLRLHLGLARQGVFPSPTEWQVVAERLPEDVPPLDEPRQGERKGWCWLYASAVLPPLRTQRVNLNALLKQRERVAGRGNAG